MSSLATNSIGIRFRRWDATSTSSGEAWHDISEITGFTNEITRETIDVTHLGSSSGYRDFIGSFRDSGVVTLPMNFIAANYALLKDDAESDDEQNYSIVLPDTGETTLSFVGVVSSLKLAGSVGNVISSECTIKISGKIEKSSGASSGL